MRNRPFAKPEIEEPGRVQMRHHEGGIVCTVEQTVSGNHDDLTHLVRDTISGLARWTAEQGGLVGHIKASLQTSSGTLIFSCTGGDVHIRAFSDPGASLQFTAIVFFVDEEQLRERLERFLDLLQQNT